MADQVNTYNSVQSVLSLFGQENAEINLQPFIDSGIITDTAKAQEQLSVYIANNTNLYSILIDSDKRSDIRQFAVEGFHNHDADMMQEIQNIGAVDLGIVWGPWNSIDAMHLELYHPERMTWF